MTAVTAEVAAAAAAATFELGWVGDVSGGVARDGGKPQAGTAGG